MTRCQQTDPNRNKYVHCQDHDNASSSFILPNQRVRDFEIQLGSILILIIIFKLLDGQQYAANYMCSVESMKNIKLDYFSRQLKGYWISFVS